jgi:mRNA-degrading endonuclease RelE of RelBE toxin-antitoxin system
MEIEYRKKFLKELSKLPNDYAKTIEDFVFDELPTCKNFEEVGKIEKMKGYKLQILPLKPKIVKPSHDKA